MESFPIQRPNSVAELCEIVKQASTQGHAIYPRGGATQFDYGFPVQKPGTIVELGDLRQVLDYPARDMTITVQAGITLAELAKVLRQEGQELPIDVPLSSRATIGGAIASNASGPRRFGFGTLRDYLIGISLVNDEGVEVKGGGRVVKNVAGYDIMKLLTNSWGTLGVITQVTLKVRPLAEKREAILIPCESSDLGTLWELGRTTKTRPTAIEVISPGVPMGLGGKWRVWVAFEDNAESVAWQVQTFLNELPQQLKATAQTISGADYQKQLAFLTDYPFLAEHPATLKINDRPSKATELAHTTATEMPSDILGRVGSGILYVMLKPEAAKSIGDVQSQIFRRLSPDGNCVILNCPVDLKNTLPIWGVEKGDLGLMRSVKKALDPKGIFNPNRFVGRI